MANFDPVSFPDAIRQLFLMNNYNVMGPKNINGAEIDLIAHPLSDPFGNDIYIEATIEYVDNDKYGRDVTKLAMIREMYPSAHLLIVSAAGFSKPVHERAEKTRIQVMTYEELFKMFEKFDPYLETLSQKKALGKEISQLNDIYEPPFFIDNQGKDLATSFLTNWRDSQKKGWLIVIGEYGTGKTALTKILQFKWINDYISNPSKPIPFRIELRNFPKQFDSIGLLHHFLDHNCLGHLSIEFILKLIREGRIILILDGYDEMAQYLHPRERRTCLEALADLSEDGAKGILTSRPNYFTEAEELQVFEILYSTLEHGGYLLDKDSEPILEKEKKVDKLLEQFIYRNERILNDLDQRQTEALIDRVLVNDARGKSIIRNILRMIFRTLEKGDAVSLSGKPVIISYLLELIEELKSDEQLEFESLSEWQVYKLIVDKLMLRDLRRSPELNPQARRVFLQKLACYLSKRENASISEDDFRELVSKEFKIELNRLSGETKLIQLDRYFSDLRSSSSLTRSKESGREGWRFSHNSLREYLVSEYMLASLEGDGSLNEKIPISDAMRIFCASQSLEERKHLLVLLSRQIKEKSTSEARGQLVTLLWDSFYSIYINEEDPSKCVLEAISGNTLALIACDLSSIEISTESMPSSLKGANFSYGNFTDINFSFADLSGVKFNSCTLENVNFDSSVLTNADFNQSMLVDVNLSKAEVGGCLFEEVDDECISIIVEKDNSKIKMDGIKALGFLRFNGAITKELPIAAIVVNHPKFEIVEKISVRLSQQTTHQVRGLAQRGSAHKDPPFARDFLSYLENNGLIEPVKGRKDQIDVTDAGREVFGQFVKAITKGTLKFPDVIIKFCQKTLLDDANNN